MRKMWKKVMASVLVIVLSVSTFMTSDWTTAKAEAATADGLKVIGASIRFIDENTAVDGIRFAVGVTTEAFEAMSESQKQNYHLLVMPTVLVDGELEKGESYSYSGGTAYAQDIQIDWAKATEESGYKVVRIYLNEIDASYVTTGLTARAYSQDGDNAPVYSEAIERSYYSVANSALNDVNADNTGAYTNEAGTQYSPYNATQRDALLGVKYEKSGKWDLQDGNLIQQSESSTDSLSDRMIRTAEDGAYVIYTSFKTRVRDHIVGNLGGFRFLVNEAGTAYVELGYYSPNATANQNIYAALRGTDDGTVWEFANSNDCGGITLQAETWYDFKINVYKQEGSIAIDVDYKPTENTGATYAKLIKTLTINGTQTTPDNYGNKTIMYSARNYAGQTYSADIEYGTVNYNRRTDTLGTTVMTQVDNGVKINQVGGGQVFVTDLNKQLPSTTNFKVEVDLSAALSPTGNFQNTQGLIVGNYQVVICADRVSVYDPGGEISPLGEWQTNLTNLDNDLKTNSFTFIVSVLEQKMTVGVRIDGTETTLIEDYNLTQAVSGTAVEYYSSTTSLGTSETIERSFTNLKITEAQKYSVSTNTATSMTMASLDNGLKLTQTGGKVIVKDLMNQLPNYNNFTMEVDLCKCVTDSTNFVNLQGVKVGDYYVLLCDDRITVQKDTETGWHTVLTKKDSDLRTYDFTLIVSVKGTVMTISARYNNIEYPLHIYELPTELTSTTISYYSELVSETSAERTFTNLQLTDNASAYRLGHTSTAAELITLDNGVQVTHGSGEVDITDAIHSIPTANRSNFTLAVEMSPVSDGDSSNPWTNIQGLRLGLLQIAINGTRVGVYDPTYSGSGWDLKLIDDIDKELATKLKEADFTFIVTVSGTTLTITVRTDEGDTQVWSGTISSTLYTDIIQYLSTNNSSEDMVRTFKNLTITTN